MRAMATGAFLGIVGVLIEERALFIRMALGTDLLHTCFFELVFIYTAVRFMAVRAEDLLFMYRMMAWHGKLCLDFLMALFAHIFHLRPPDGEIRPHVDVMTIEAGHVIDRMYSGIPVVKIKI